MLSAPLRAAFVIRKFLRSGFCADRCVLLLRPGRRHLGGRDGYGRESDPAPGLGQALGGRLLNTHAKNLFELKTRGPKRWLIVDVFVQFWDVLAKFLFCDLLQQWDRRLKRLEEMKLLEANGSKVMEATEVETKPQPEVETKPPLPRTS
jgi:hypothetical protein